MRQSERFGFFKFLVGTLFGIILVLIPFNFSNGMDTILFHYLKLFINSYQTIIQSLLVICVVLSALLSLYNLLVKDNFIQKNRLLKKLFATTPFYVANRFAGAVISLLCFFKVGPNFIISVDTGTAMLDLATQLSILVPMMLLFQTFILEFGAMEFLGELIGFIVKPLFKVSEICAVNIISAWVGPGNAAILGTQELFQKGYFTVKEAAVIGSQFSTSSVGWVVLVSSVLGLMDYFWLIFLGITVIGMVLGIISVRIPPIKNYPNTYVDGSTVSKVTTNDSGSKLAIAYKNSAHRANSVTLKNFTSKIDNMTFYVFWLTPIIIFWGTAALIVSMYTPILAWVSLPVELILNLFGVPDASVTASAIMSGFADNYLPVILGKDLVSIESKAIIAMMSILQLIFMSEIATLLKSCQIINKFRDIIIIFLERTFISLPFVILFVKLFIS
ncbi:arginine transporter [Vagococcus penaei]|uniref:Arginine transporter n=1 Tax=Vagococcus penaei TaxID=633807 RepID=A0A1Q2D3S0_9ENTE|nr:arginine transporter [Vagococcus penaei]AQP53008.1 arginine transporter [Vagococcus penaei]RSU02532.1 arginine transporter [Vagococcus penaei]